MLIPVVILLVMANKKLPPLPTILTGALVGIVFALLFQQPAISAMTAESGNGALAAFKGVWQTLFDGYLMDSGDSALDDLLTRGGMSSMLNTVWLILCAMIFGALMDRTGLINVLVKYALTMVRGTGSLILTTLLTCIGANMIASDQYIAIVLPGRMYKMEFQRRGLDVKNLSRTLEDAGTITSPLIPWNTCGAFMSGTLGIATFAYAPFCFFNLINPIVSALYGFMNFKIAPADNSGEMIESIV
jgi:NhaC family Na+:H+ antiporter